MDRLSPPQYPWPVPHMPTPTRYAMIGEYGGVGYFAAGKEWVPTKCHTYLHAPTAATAVGLYINMTRRLVEMVTTGLSAAIYTQITDVELECDGFLNYDRSSKLSSSQIKAIREANQMLIRKGSMKGSGA